MSQDVMEGLIVALSTFLASGTGFWAYLQRRDNERDARTKLLMGLASDKLMFLGLRFIEQGFVTQDQYEDLTKYLYEPYVALGGNGSAERIMHAVQRLPIRSTHILDTDIRSTDRTADHPEASHDHQP